ncbi:MAG: mechanosensitive ion channel family protein [Verrucomicrobia bacterium]|nr:MAG: mechanosensitive ion channel family protein [Verrucomicrobiota bacterium]
MTRWRFEWVYRFGLALLLATAFWAVWANAAEPAKTNDTSAVTTNTPLGSFGVTNALTRSLSHVRWLSETRPLGEPLWKYVASIIYIFLAFYVARLVDFIINGWLKRWAAKTETKYDDLMLELLRGPVKVVTFVIFLHIGLGVFDWPPRAQVFLSRVLIVVVACSITYVVLKVVDVFLGVWREKFASAEDKLFAEHLFPVISKATKTALIIAAVLLTADNLHIEIKTLLAGLSIGGLALGLAAQDTVANLFGAVAIFLDKPFRIGDRIKVEGAEGMVESIGLRSTRVRSLDGHHVTIPNKMMGNAIITNITRRPTIRTEMNIGITYDTPMEKVKQATIILEEIFRAHPKTADLIISFNKFADSALNILVVHVWDGTDAKEHFAGMQELNLTIKHRFDAEKIEFAFPSQTIYLKQT